MNSFHPTPTRFYHNLCVEHSVHQFVITYCDAKIACLGLVSVLNVGTVVFFFLYKIVSRASFLFRTTLTYDYI